MANCFIIGCEKTRKAAVIDPGDDSSQILMKLAEHKLTVEYIINTHGHFDHVGANRKLKEATGAKLVIHALDQSMLKVLSETSAAFGLSVENSPPPDQTVQDGDIIQFGEIILTVLHTPGHTPGGISLHTDGVVFVGDTLFAGSIGRTDFPGGDFDTLISSIKNKLYSLGDQVIVYTGHGPETTIGREKRSNPFASM
jgi:glyoxylase-like metal-dependent hydrolase (beta-lactamase superfamily II)